MKDPLIGLVLIGLIFIGGVQLQAADKLAQKPPMGWNSFDSYNCAIYEELALKEAKAFIDKYAPHGYEYFVIDNGWFSSPETMQVDGLMCPVSQHADPKDVTINKYGIVQPSKKFFPNGFKPLVDMLHKKGLKFGIHLMRGIPRKAVEQNTPIKGTKYHARDIYTEYENCGWCSYMHGVDMNKPGAQEFYDSVLKEFASWGLDFIKVDDVVHKPAELKAYTKAIKKCGRPMIFSISPGGPANKKYLDVLQGGHMVRITKDIWDDMTGVGRAFQSWREWQGLERPGFWPDLDMIPFGELCILKREANQKAAKAKNTRFGGHLNHWCEFTRAQKETFITMRALGASPLMIGGSMINMDKESYNMLVSKEMIRCDQNGVMGRLMWEDDGFEIWLTPENNRDEWGYQRYKYPPKGWFGVFNRTEKKRSLNLDGKILGKMGWDKKLSFKALDVWKNKKFDIEKGSGMKLEIEPDGVAFIRFDKK